MSKPNKVCVYAISKNEAKFVERWYESMKEADCVVVLDTGSEDNTVELLEAVGVDIVETKEIIPWRFDDARNESLKLVPEDCNILVCTDLDEVFEPGWADILRDNWDDEKYERVEYTYIWRHNQDGSPVVKYNYNKIHNREWVWRTPVHEYLTRKDNEKNFYYLKEKALRLHDSIVLHHYPDDSKSRSNYLELLKIRVDEYPDDLVSSIYLAREYWFYKQYQNAIDALQKVFENHRCFPKIQIAFAYYLMGNCYMGLAKGTTDNENKQGYILLAEKSFSSGIDYNPEFMENYTKLGELYTLYEYYEEAINIIQLGFSKAVRQHNWVEDGSNWTYIPLTIMGACEFYIGEKTNSVYSKSVAISCFAKALSYNPDNADLRNNFDMAVSAVSISEIINQ